MGSNNLRFQIIVRIAAIALTLYLLMELVSTDAFAITIILALILVIVQVIALIRFVDKSHKTIDDFFNAIKNNDFSMAESADSTEPYLKYLHDQFAEVIKKLKKSRLTKDEHQQYLTTIVQHVGIGLLTFNETGDIQIMNIAAKRLLKVENTKNIHDLTNISEELVK